MPPPQHQFALGTRKSRRGLNSVSKGDVRARWWNCESKTHPRLMQSARGHCRCGESIASPPTIPVACNAHDLSDASKPPCRRCVDNLTLRCKFMVHDSMAVKKNHQNDFDFWFAFPWFFRSRRIFLFPLFALRLQLVVILVDPWFVACDETFQEFIAFLWGFPVNATLFPSQLLLRSEQFRYNLGTNLFHFQMFHKKCVNGQFSQTKFYLLSF